MKSCEFAVSISALACCIADGKSPEEIALISSVFMQLGDTLSTIAARDALCSLQKPEISAKTADTSHDSPAQPGQAPEKC